MMSRRFRFLILSESIYHSAQNAAVLTGVRSQRPSDKSESWKSFFKIKESSRAGLCSVAPLLRGADIAQAQRVCDESKMRECLRELKLLPRLRLVFFRQTPPVSMAASTVLVVALFRHHTRLLLLQKGRKIAIE
jgi:hypothetical protein